MARALQSYETPKGTPVMNANGEVLKAPCQQEVVKNPHGSYVIDLSHEERIEIAKRFAERKNGKH